MGKTEFELDIIQIERLMKVVHPSTDDMDIIFSLYKKYIDGTVTHYSVNCNCPNGISTLWNKVKEWYSKNKPQ